MKIGFVGLGDMGLPMAQRLLSDGCDLIAWNRSPAPLETLVAKGATAATSPARAVYDRVTTHPDLSFDSDLSALVRLYEADIDPSDKGMDL